MDRLLKLAERLTEIGKLDAADEDYPGQYTEMRRQAVIQMAAEAADELIMCGSEGSPEETNYLTSAVAQIMNNRVHQTNVMALMKADLLNRRTPKEN